MEDIEFHGEVNEGLHKIIDIAKILISFFI